MHRATNQVKGFYAKTEKPARLNILVGPRLPFAPTPDGEASRSSCPRHGHRRKLRLLNVPLEDTASAVPNRIKNQAL